METENDLQKPQKPTKKINMGYIFGIFMILIYFGMAYLLIFTPLFENTFSEIFRYSIGIVSQYMVSLGPIDKLETRGIVMEIL